MSYELLDRFRAVFDGVVYIHRKSTIGDHVAVELFEDLYNIKRSAKYVKNIDAGLSVLNRANNRHGIVARRGDGTLGEIIPYIAGKVEKGFKIPRGPTATIQIGIEVKLLQKAMIKQIGRVVNNLTEQITHFKSRGGLPICVGIVGINHAPYTVGFEGNAVWRTDGKKHKHPIQEAAEAEKRLMSRVAPLFDEFIVLRYTATNDAPYPFSWVNAVRTQNDYGAALARISRLFETRF